MKLKNIVKSMFRHLGIEIARYTPSNSDDAKLMATYRHLGVNLIFDVGANTGQYAQRARRFGYKGRIVSFEPLSEAHSVLEKSASNDKLWTIHPRCAVGDQIGKVSINVSGNSYSSSILPMLKTHSEAAPESKYIASEITDLITLDSVFFDYHRNDEKTYLKFDTQGFEKQGLDGATRSLPYVRAIELELSLVPLYEGQELWIYFISRLRKAGFTLWSIIPGFLDSHTGQLLQVDAIFVKSPD